MRRRHESSDPDRCTVVVLFEDEELARQNSARPESDQFFREWMRRVDGEPEFVDADVVHAM
jgi:hypothetical protein